MLVGQGMFKRRKEGREYVVVVLTLPLVFFVSV
jgi:hypothetical protein